MLLSHDYLIIIVLTSGLMAESNLIKEQLKPAIMLCQYYKLRTYYQTLDICKLLHRFYIHQECIVYHVYRNTNQFSGRRTSRFFLHAFMYRGRLSYSGHFSQFVMIRL